MSEKKEELAERRFRLALSIHQDSAGLRDLAMAYHETHNHVMALQAFKRLARGLPPDTDVLLRPGITYGDLGRPQKAIAVWRRSLEIDSAEKEAARNIEIALEEIRSERQSCTDRLDIGKLLPG